MAYKLSFRFEREDHTIEGSVENNNEIRTLLSSKLDEKLIRTHRIYTPSRNSIKVLFPSDEEVNKVLQDTQHFIAVISPKNIYDIKSQ